MTTYRDMLNRVLTTLGEDLVPDGSGELSSDYHKLVGEFLNQVKEEIEDAHNWRSLRKDLTATVTADAVSASITDSNERARLVRVTDQTWGRQVAVVFDTTDANSPVPLHEVDLSELLYFDRQDPTTRASGSPRYFAVDDSPGDSLDVYVWPRPSTERTIKLYMVVPQARLSATDVDTIILIPGRALEMGTLWYAQEERGEELGAQALFSQTRFNEALDSAIARDSAEQGGYELTPE